MSGVSCIWRVKIQRLNFGRFEPMPDFAYLRARFEEYDESLSRNYGEITQAAHLNKWIVGLRPKLVSNEADEVELLSAYVRFLERPPELIFRGTKMFAEDLANLSESNW